MNRHLAPVYNCQKEFNQSNNSSKQLHAIFKWPRSSCELISHSLFQEERYLKWEPRAAMIARAFKSLSAQ